MKSFHLVHCSERPSEDGWLIVGAVSAADAAQRSLDYYWPTWSAANVVVRNELGETFRLRCERTHDQVLLEEML